MSGRRSFLLGSAATLAAGAGLRPLPASAAELVWIGKNRWLFPAWDSLSEPGTAGIAKALDLIGQASVMFASKDVGLLLIVVPFKARYYERQLPDRMALSDGVRARYARILETARQLGIKTVDLNAAILPVATANQTIYYHTDQHWTAWSAEAAGAAVAEAIRKNWQLAGAGGGDRLGGWMTERRLGDLAALLPKEQQAKLGDETYVVRQAYGADLNAQDGTNGNGLLPAGTVAVHVVGNSFSRPNWGLPQKLSNALDRPVGLTWLRGDVGPWQIMLNYVESAQFKSPPKTIVWQLNESQLQYGPTAPDYWFDASQMTPEVWLARMKAAIGA